MKKRLQDLNETEKWPKVASRGLPRLRTRGKPPETECYWGRPEIHRFNYVYKGQYMLHRKIYQLCGDGREVCVFREQRWIERARIIDIEGI